MCRNGINLTQFKLSVHQLSKFTETLATSLEQWENLANQLGLQGLSEEIKEARKQAENLNSKITEIIKAADDVEESGGDVVITPI